MKNEETGTVNDNDRK